MYIRRGFVFLALSFVLRFSTEAGFLGYRAGQANAPIQPVPIAYINAANAYTACAAELSEIQQLSLEWGPWLTVYQRGH